MKYVRSSQPCISMNFVLNSTKHKFFHVSIVKELLRKDSLLTIHQKNLKLLVTEMFKVKFACAPDIIKEILEIDNRNYNFCHYF